MEGMIRNLESQVAESNTHSDPVLNSISNLYGKAINSVRESKIHHTRGDFQTAVSMMHHAAEQACSAAKLHGAGSSISSLKAIASNYASDVGR
jgi:hypothetical protein